jgi:hypothetical protein
VACFTRRPRRVWRRVYVPRPIRYWWRLSSRHLTIRTDRCGRRPVSAGPVRHSGSMALDAVERDTVCSVSSRTKHSRISGSTYLVMVGYAINPSSQRIGSHKADTISSEHRFMTPAAIEGEWLELVPVTFHCSGGVFADSQRPVQCLVTAANGCCQLLDRPVIVPEFAYRFRVLASKCFKTPCSKQ